VALRPEDKVLMSVSGKRNRAKKTPGKGNGMVASSEGRISHMVMRNSAEVGVARLSDRKVLEGKISGKKERKRIMRGGGGLRVLQKAHTRVVFKISVQSGGGVLKGKQQAMFCQDRRGKKRGEKFHENQFTWQ